MPELKLSWLGPSIVELKGQPIQFEMRKVSALLVYLSLHRGEVARESLAAMFWPEKDQQHAMGSLRRALSSLSNSLISNSLRIDREMVGLADPSQVWMDVEEFRQQVAKVNLHHSKNQTNGEKSTICSDCLAALEEAVKYYRGDFLEGFNLKDCPEFDDWQFAQRENLRGELANTLQLLVQGYGARQEWGRAVPYAQRWVSLDRLDEAAQRALIRLLLQTDQRNAALHQYENLVRLLKNELGQVPEKETTQLYESILANRGKVVEKPNQTTIGQGREAEPLIKTKLFIPPLRVDRVPRPRLLDLIDAGAQRSLTLISAPAGFGKTTLLASWASHTRLPIAWFAMDEGDNDPFRFMTYLIAALDSILVGIGEQFQDLKQSLQPSIHPTLVRLVNYLAGESEPFVLILDDYQFINSQDIHQALSFLLGKIPACLHLIIATRADPPLTLARLRARDQLIEIRANDLRFNQEESASFLMQVMALQLSNTDISALEVRTEGWIAGLQMAALAIRALVIHQLPKETFLGESHQNVSKFIDAFSGSHRYILDYLGEEVLSRHSLETRRFLLQTSLLERFSASLCDAVNGIEGSQTILEELEKENLFLVPLDDERHWYRYHHLFAELLRYQLEEALTNTSNTVRMELDSSEKLHWRAAEWFETNRFFDEAVQHYLAARVYEQAAALIETQMDPMLFITGQVYTLSGWLAMLPTDLLRVRPRLNIAKAWTSILQSKFTTALEPLEEASKAVMSLQEAEANRILGEVALVRGALAELSTRNVEAMRTQSLIAWEKLPLEDSMLRGMAAWLLGASYYWDGDTQQAESYFTQAINLCRNAGNSYITLLAIENLNGALRDQGKYREAYHLLQQTQEEMTSGGRQPHPILGHLHISSSQILLQWNQLEEAEQQVSMGIDLVAQDTPGEILLFGISVLPYLKLAQGKWEDALRLAEECLERVESYPLPYTRSLIKANLIRFWIRVEERNRIEEWLCNCGLTSDDPVSYLREAEYIALAKVFIWQERTEEALKVLSKIYGLSQSQGRNGKLYYILALQALAHKQLNDLENALKALESSLKLAQSEGYIRAYVDEGKPMEELLQLGAARGIWSRIYLDGYADRLLKAIEEDQNRVGIVGPKNRYPFQSQQSTSDSLVEGFSERERLTERELDVLRLAAEGLSNPQISDVLSLSVGTVKTHLHHIFDKLGVQGRVNAIRMAKEQRLL